MTEEKTEEIKPEQKKETPKDEEIKTQEVSPLDEAKALLEENKKFLAQISEERKKIEKAAATMMISGRGFAGNAKREETEDEKWAREAKQRYAGTGMDPT